MNRRQFLTLPVALAALSLLPSKSNAKGLKLQPVEVGQVKDGQGKKYAFLWSVSKCIFCGACVAACNAVNYGRDKSPNASWGWPQANTKIVETEHGDLPRFIFIQCQHCEDAPCVRNCPTGASYVDKDGGIVLVDYNLCVGCKYCISSCPYDARWINKEGTPSKCTWCIQRVKSGGLPACVAFCPVGARDFGDINDPNSSISKRLAAAKRVYVLMPEKNTKPKFFIVEE
ncbi:4Fe-4S dicluster domain-containing protein [Pyrobaculum calidifontis]|uniref:4Fe-4S dicluster domain-containing protein n=1 Tax=Pyrobaculum calidifontis TaxID=181486 RepID=UPI00186BAC85|nr:4Fe-4S dicluster domain-containing protein [Pyrobaculum calidifontis]